ncbi:MAG: MFS transporter [Ignavibacteria bacterium]
MLEMQKRLTNFFYAVLSLPATAMGFALSIQISALSWIMRTQYNLDLHEIGIVWAAGPLAGIIGQPIVGLISDKVWFWGGRRKPFVFIGATLAALMLLALPNIQEINNIVGIGSIVFISTVTALTLDLAINVSFNPTRSIIADVTPEGVPRTKGYTWMQTISGTFGVAAYAIGALFGNYTLIYVGIFLVLLFSIPPMLLIKESKELQYKSGEENDGANGEDNTEWVEFTKVLLAHAFSWIGVQTMFIYIIGYIEQKLNPASSDETGQIIAVSFLILNAVGAILPAFILEPATEKIGRVKTHLICVSVMSIAYWGIVLFGKSTVSLYVLMALAGVGWAAIVSLPFAIMSEKVEKGRMGFFMGIFNLSVVLPQLFVSLAVGYFVNAADDKNIIFIISGVSLAISAVLWMIVKESKAIKADMAKHSSG